MTSGLDVIHLQEIWFKKDYDFMKDCTIHRYQASQFDTECGSLNDMTFLKCSGLMTLVTEDANLSDAKYLKLPKGDDFATTTDPAQYFDNLVNRKVMTINAEIRGSKYLLVNTHMTPYHKKATENREQREKEAHIICDTISMDNGDWDMVALGMDMNDLPRSSVYDIFVGCGLIDVFNPDQSESATYPITYGDVDNTWVEDDGVTLDYVMVMKGSNTIGEVDVEKVTSIDLQTEGDERFSLSDHNAVISTITLL